MLTSPDAPVGITPVSRISRSEGQSCQHLPQSRMTGNRIFAPFALGQQARVSLTAAW